MSNESDRTERARKPRKCPTCGTSPVANIMYGMPAYSQELEEALNEGRLTLGGCCLSGDDPKWKCTRCGLEIYKKHRESLD